LVSVELYSTVASSFAKLTAELLTPSRFFSFVSILSAQEAQVIPLSFIFTFSLDSETI
jgi:hypothetical protein